MFFCKVNNLTVFSYKIYIPDFLLISLPRIFLCQREPTFKNPIQWPSWDAQEWCMLRLFPWLFPLLCLLRIWCFSLAHLNTAALLFDSCSYCSRFPWWELSPVLKSQLTVCWRWFSLSVLFITVRLFLICEHLWFPVSLCSYMQRVVNEWGSGAASGLTSSLCSAGHFNRSFLLQPPLFTLDTYKNKV